MTTNQPCCGNVLQEPSYTRRSRRIPRAQAAIDAQATELRSTSSGACRTSPSQTQGCRSVPESVHGLGVHVVGSERGQSSWRSTQGVFNSGHQAVLVVVVVSD